MELNTFRQEGGVLGPWVCAFGGVKCLVDVIADTLTAEHLSYDGDRGSKTVNTYYRRMLYRARGPSAHHAWARRILDRRGLVQTPNAPRDQSQYS